MLLGAVWCTPNVLAQHESHQQSKQAHAEKKHQSKAQAERQALCPIMGGEINPTVLAEIDGRTVYFCCPGCKKGFLKDKAANFKKLDEQIERNKTAWAKKCAAADKVHKKP